MGSVSKPATASLDEKSAYILKHAYRTYAYLIMLADAAGEIGMQSRDFNVEISETSETMSLYDAAESTLRVMAGILGIDASNAENMKILSEEAENSVWACPGARTLPSETITKIMERISVKNDG